MKVKLLIIIMLLAVTRVASAGCWQNKQKEMLQLKTHVIMALENTDPQQWHFGYSKNLNYVRVIENGKKIIVSISDWGTLSINHRTIDLPRYLEERVKRLYRKIACKKNSKESQFMKGFLQTF